LSPAYDVNPIEQGTGLSLNISDSSNALELDLAMSVSNYFRMSDKRAHEIVKEVTSAVSNWNRIAKDLGISKTECELKANAFKFYK
jgi:serine/threonine-protein kinase HipA